MMNLSKHICLSLFLVYGLFASAEALKKKKSTPAPAYPYASEFKKVDSLLHQVDQPEAAERALLFIQQKANSEGQKGYYIRTVQYLVSLINSRTEEDDTSAPGWYLIQAEIAKGTNDIKAFLYMDAASFLKEVYENVRWEYGRIADDNSKNPRRWSVAKIIIELNRSIDQSLQYGQALNNDPVYEPLITNFARHDFKLDIGQVLLRNAIGLMDNLEDAVNADYESPLSKDALAPYQEFLNKDFRIKSDPKNEYRRLRFYQSFLHSILKSADMDRNNALIYFEIERLVALKDHYYDDESYRASIEHLWKEFYNLPYSNLAAEKLASFYETADPVKAMAIIKEAIQKFPGFLNQNALISIKHSIERPEVNMVTETLYQPGKKMLAKIIGRNVGKVYITAYKFDLIDFLHMEGRNNSYNSDHIKAYTDSLQPFAKTYSLQLPVYVDYRNHSTEVALDSLPAGYYILIVSNAADAGDSAAVSVYGKLSVAPYTLLTVNDDIFLKNAVNGAACNNEVFRIYAGTPGHYNSALYKKIYEGRTNADGFLDLGPVDKNYRSGNIVIEIGNHVLYDTRYFSDFERDYTSDNANTVAYKTITDRSIYRPGQKVYFKCIVYDYKLKKTIAGRKADVVLKNNNGEEKGRLSLISNTYGSVSGEFILPSGGFNTGDFSITVNEQYGLYFKVEEYKRPKYRAEFLAPEKAYKLNDEVTVVGQAKAFAGYAIQEAKVEYTVVRKLKPRYFDWGYYKPWYYNRGEEMVVTTGHTVSDQDGKFSVRFKAVPDENQPKKDNPYFIFEISAVITDQNGETKTCNYSLTMAYTDLQLSIAADEDNVFGRAVELAYSCTNLQNVPQPFSGTFSVERIAEGQKIFRQRFWERTDTSIISEKDFNEWFPSYLYADKKPLLKPVMSRTVLGDTKKSLIIPASELKEAGSYRATIKGLDSRGEMVSSACEFRITPNTPGPYQMAEPLRIQVVNGNTFEPKAKARILISSGLPDARVMVTIRSHRGLILKKEMLLNRSSEVLVIPVTPADRGNINVVAYTVNDYRFYNTAKEVYVPYSNKELNISLQSFRDETEPGAKEKWIVKLKGPASEKAAMESVAVMYDQSLDAIYASADWHLNIFENYYNYEPYKTNFVEVYYNILKAPQQGIYNPYWFKIPSYQSFYGMQRAYGYNTYYADGAAGGVDKMVIVRQNKSFARGKQDIEEEAKSEPGIDKPVEPMPVIRKNFDETAFFYPHLLAGRKGEIILEFTMPEALTQWKLRMLSHSTTMQTGYFEKSITTSKKVMVQPNVPRFLRQGDAITLAAKVVNTTASPISSKVNLVITDEATGLPLNWAQDKGVKNIQVPANGSTPFSYSILVPDFTGVVSVAFTANAGNFSDGEQHTVPVLSNRTLLTESVPLTIRTKGTHDIEFSSLQNNKSTTLVHEKLSVEMCNNPAWYAIQSLPYLMEFPHECAEQIFTRLYANSVAAHLANSDPAIRKVYETWVRQAANGNGLQSKLSLNQDLKNVVIEETPWLNDAKNETERMQKLGVLFDQKKMKEEQETAFEKLNQMQSENGAFGWFKGMQPNSYITQTIVIGFGKMKKMGVDISTYKNMIDKAMAYLDNEARKDYIYYHNFKEFKNFLPANLQYLYCKSYFPETGLNANDSIVRYFVENSEKTWVGSGLMNRAQLCTALKVLKPASKIPDLILQSFTENAKKSDNMGMYWSAPKYACYWYEAPVETQAAIIEAYSGSSNTAALIREQRIWLLNQKHTQDWGSTRSTADACYALLMHGILLNNSQKVTVKINQKAIEPTQIQEGTGYFRENVPKEQITTGSGNIQVIATTDDFTYGAIYWQYFEDFDKVQKTGSGLSIDKKIYKIENTVNGKVKTEISGTEINVGDLLEISLNISSDRNLEFVHIKDLRGAGTEPVDVLSEYKWQNGLGYYQSTRDAATHFFIDNMAKGIYQINYTLKVEQAGTYSNGTASVQCMYAPEFTANSKGIILNVK